MENLTTESRIRHLPPVRLTRAERQALEAEAGRLGLSMSDYARQALSLYVTLTKGGLTYEGNRPRA
jgi:hypothetical protein